MTIGAYPDKRRAFGTKPASWVQPPFARTATTRCSPGRSRSLMASVEFLDPSGVVEMAVDEPDRRRSLIRITDSARREVFAERGQRSVADELRQRFPERSEAQLAQVEALLEALADQLCD